MYDHSLVPDNPPEMLQQCLQPCVGLLEANIPFIVWGEYALRFAFNVPTYVPHEMTILLPDDLLERAANAIQSFLPSFSPLKKSRWMRRYPGAQVLQDKSCKKKEYRGDTMYTAILIPENLFAFHTDNPALCQRLSSSVVCDIEDSRVHACTFPTLAAFFDSLISSQSRYRNFWKGEQQLKLYLSMHTWIDYLGIYVFRADSGPLYSSFEDLPPSIKAVAGQLKEENKDYFVGLFMQE